jgi:hypothetical protein
VQSICVIDPRFIFALMLNRSGRSEAFLESEQALSPTRRRRKTCRSVSSAPPAYKVFSSNSSPRKVAPACGKRRTNSSRCACVRRYFFSISSPIEEKMLDAGFWMLVIEHITPASNI